jgi:hypothetical protein
MLTRDQILAAADLPFEDLDVPEWGGTVRVQGLSLGALFAIDAGATRKDGAIDTEKRVRAMLAASIVGEDGKPLFGEADLEGLSRKSAVVLRRLLAVVDALNGTGAGAVEDLEKNLDGEEDGVSPSASRSLSDAPLRRSKAA